MYRYRLAKEYLSTHNKDENVSSFRNFVKKLKTFNALIAISAMSNWSKNFFKSKTKKKDFSGTGIKRW